MENITGGKPASWTFVNPDGVASVSQQGRVHSGQASVSIKDKSAIRQTSAKVSGGCYYELSFFARSEGANAGFTAKLLFVTASGTTTGAEITVSRLDTPNSNRSFGYYRILSSAAPAGLTAITVEISADAEGNQNILIDDVSLSIA